jgi:hypothetical protein
MRGWLGRVAEVGKRQREAGPPVGRMEPSVTAYKGNRWLDLRRAFRPVPGLEVSYLQFPMAHAMGYFLSPSGLDVSEESRVSRFSRLSSRGQFGVHCPLALAPKLTHGAEASR